MPKSLKKTLLTTHKHDAYFKTVFSKKENVIPFLHHFLSQDSFLAQEVLPLIDFTSLTFINSEVISSTNLSKLM